MPVGYTTWTVCPHDPIEKLDPKLWRVSGMMENGRVQRSMSIARRADGDLIVFNAIALDEPEMAELTSFGRVAWLVVPNAYHRQDIFTWKQRFPDAKVVAPRGGVKAVSKAVPVDLCCDELPKDPEIWLGHTEGCGEKEALMIVPGREGASVVANDVLCNLPASKGFPLSLFMGPLGRLSVPRAIRWFLVKDTRAVADQLDRLGQDLARIIPGHGQILTGAAAKEGLAGAAALLRS